MNLGQAVKAFETAFQQERVWNGKEKRFGPIAESSYQSILSCVRYAVRAATGNDSEATDLSDLLSELPAEAQAAAASDGKTNPSSYRSRVQAFVTTVNRDREPRLPSKKRVFPSTWAGVEPDVPAADRWAFAAIAEVCHRKGRSGPEDVPVASELRSLLGEAGYTDSSARTIIATYRRCARALRSRGHPLPDIDLEAVSGELGLRGLSDIVDRMKQAGLRTAPRDVTCGELIEKLAPKMWTAMEAIFRTTRFRSVTQQRELQAVSRMLAAYVDSGCEEVLGVPVGDVDGPLLLLATIEVDVEPHVPSHDHAHLRAFLSDESQKELDQAPEKTRIPVLGFLARHRARKAGLIEDRWPLPAVDDLRRWTRTCRAITDLDKKLKYLPDVIAANQALHDLADEEEKAARSIARPKKNKALIVASATWAEMVLIGLPALRANALRAREAVDAGRSDESLQNYYNALFDYVLMAVFYLDGLRLSNYRCARVGTTADTEVDSRTHIHPVFRDGRLVQLHTVFYGDDASPASLKIDTDGNGSYRVRPGYIRPGMVDLTLVEEFLVRARPWFLESSRTIVSAAEYDLRYDLDVLHLAFLPSPRRARTNAFSLSTGAWGETGIMERFSGVYRWVVEEVLGRELPDDGWGIDTPHVARLQLGTYLGGILGRMEEAAAMINDTVSTLQKHYKLIEPFLARRTGWEKPQFFAERMLRLWDEETAIDWAEFDPWEGVPEQERPRGWRLVYG